MLIHFLILLLSPVGLCEKTLRPLTVITKGAFLREIPGVLVHSSSEMILEPIPDIPSFDFLSDMECVDCLEAITNTSLANEKAINATYDLIASLGAVFSYRGIEYSLPEYIFPDPSKTLKRAEQADEVESMPNREEIDRVGGQLFKSIVKRIRGRDIISNMTESNSRTVRSAAVISQIVSPILQHLGSKLFLPKNGIFQLLLRLASSKPDSLLNFALSPKFLTKVTTNSVRGFRTYFEAERQAKQSYDILKTEDKVDFLQQVSTEGNKKYDDSYKEVFNYLFRIVADLSVHMHQSANTIFQSQRQIGQIVNLNNMLTQQLLHHNALQACRDGTISTTFLPPSLLQKRISDLREILPLKMEFVIPFNDIHRLYSLKNTKCHFDVDGGIIETIIPTKRVDENFKFFSFESLPFAWHNKTCTINIESGYVAFDTVQRQTYPIRHDVGDLCQPTEGKLCLINEMTTGGWEDDLCVRTMLEGGTAEDVDKACQLKCVESRRLISTRLDEVTFILAHLPKEGAVVHCEGFPDTLIVHDFDTGAFRVTLAPHCEIHVNGKIVSRAGRKTGIRLDSPITVQHLIPSHWTHLDKWVVYDDTSSSEITFKNISQFLDDDWMTNTYKTVVDNVSIQVILQVTWMSLHSILIAYSLYKVHILAFLIMSNIGQTEGAALGVCQNIDDVYIYLYAILGLLLALFCPQFLGGIKSKLGHFWNINVDRAAIRKLEESNDVKDSEL